jgi:hypothetical protein
MNRKEKSLNTSKRTFWKIPKDERQERKEKTNSIIKVCLRITVWSNNSWIMSNIPRW